MVVLLVFFFLFQFVAADFGCQDWVSRCDVYAKKGWCAEIHPNHDYMKNMCPKICGFCGADKTTTPPKTTTTTPLPTTTSSTESPKTTYQPPTLNPLDKCQLPDVAVSRIISGRDAKPGQFPWQVAMYVNGHFSCGGSILKPDWLITAAHCLQGLQPSHNITFVAGELDRSVSSGHEQTSEI
uniref:ShKT domain-containing protein n=1 Tax=Clytia hemisphaerica TaxID=252671 RepID=A0A7M5VC52_9CNID